MPTNKIDLQDVITRIANQAARNVALNPDVPNVQPENAPIVANAVVEQINTSPEVKQAAEAVKEATTPVPWYQSSVIIGQVVALACLAWAMFGGEVIAKEHQGEIVNFLTQAGVVVGSAITLYGRLMSKAQPVVLTKPSTTVP